MSESGLNQKRMIINGFINSTEKFVNDEKMVKNNLRSELGDWRSI